MTGTVLLVGIIAAAEAVWLIVLTAALVAALVAARNRHDRVLTRMRSLSNRVSALGAEVQKAQRTRHPRTDPNRPRIDPATQQPMPPWTDPTPALPPPPPPTTPYGRHARS